jgi:hypothetical protein
VNATPTVPYQQRSPPANSPGGELPRQQASSTYRDDVSALLHQHRRVKPSTAVVFWHSGRCGGGAGCECSVSWCTADSSKAESGALWWHLPGTVCPLHAGEPPPLSGAVLGVGDSTSAVGRWCAHGELPLSPRTGFPRCCASAARWWETVTVGGWADMPEELLEKLLEVLEAVG